jgi:hypothetical protein
MKVLSKLVVFTLVCCLTWMATSAIVTQQKKRKPVVQAGQESKVNIAGPALTDSIKILKDSPRIVPMKLGASSAIAEAYLRSNKFTIEDNVASADVHVSLSDKRPGMFYVWRLRIVDSQEKPLAGKVYDQQLFSVDENGLKEVDFQDSIAVPPNAYRIELVLYEKAPWNDLSFLDNDLLAKSYERMRAVKLLK